MLHDKIAFEEKSELAPQFRVVCWYHHISTSTCIPVWLTNLGIRLGIEIALTARTDHIFVRVVLQKDLLFVSQRSSFAFVALKHLFATSRYYLH